MPDPTYQRRKRHNWSRSKSHWSTAECDANYICPHKRLPGDHLCEYHRAVEDAKAGNVDAVRVCRERYGLTLAPR